jgi:hypothetical protein
MKWKKHCHDVYPPAYCLQWALPISARPMVIHMQKARAATEKAQRQLYT